MIAITAGDVSGIGPEIVVRSMIDCSVREACLPLAICHPDMLFRAAALIGLNSIRIEQVNHADLTNAKNRASLSTNDRIIWCTDPGDDSVLNASPRTVNAAAGDAAYRYLIYATGLAKSGIVDAIATAPLNKAALHAAGHYFPGHTEILAHECGVQNFAMMLHLPESRLTELRRLIADKNTPEVSGFGISIAHVTLHTSIESVPGLLTERGIRDSIHLVNDFLSKIGCTRRAIAVCALNPHGGESGLFGDEESRLIEPAVHSASKNGLNVTGPSPVDTLMRQAFSGEFDGVVAMYHDQGHIPVKLIGFDAAVNITLGLPIVRTSPTHGTAFDRAWNAKSSVDCRGMVEAVLTAATLSKSIRPQPGTKAEQISKDTLKIENRS